jgi:hypothetical protein
MIETLPLLRPDAGRGARTVARCHQRLARRRRHREGAARRAAYARYLAVERALVCAFCVIYITGVALVAIQMLRGGG